MAKLTHDFFNGDTVAIAQALLGKVSGAELERRAAGRPHHGDGGLRGPVRQGLPRL